MSKRGVLEIEWIPLNPLLMLFVGRGEFEQDPQDVINMLERYAKELKLPRDVVDLRSAVAEGKEYTTKWKLVIPHWAVPMLVRVSWVPGGVVVPPLRLGLFDLLSVLFGR